MYSNAWPTQEKQNQIRNARTPPVLRIALTKRKKQLQQRKLSARNWLTEQPCTCFKPRQAICLLALGKAAQTCSIARQGKCKKYAEEQRKANKYKQAQGQCSTNADCALGGV
eukprot:228354-Pelagomonas_calceolata.AAC.2